MGIEWFRDLSITILGFATTAVIIFIAILFYRLYHKTQAILLRVEAASKIAYDTVSRIQDTFKPLHPMLAMIQSISGVFQGISKIFKKEKEKEETVNE